MHAFGSAQGLFGVGATDRASNIDPIADRDTLHIWTNGGNDPSPVVARRVGCRRLGINPRTDIGFDRINANRMHAHHHLARSGLWVWHLFELHDLWITKRMDTNRFHPMSPFRSTLIAAQ